MEFFVTAVLYSIERHNNATCGIKGLPILTKSPQGGFG